MVEIGFLKVENLLFLIDLKGDIGDKTRKKILNFEKRWENKKAKRYNRNKVHLSEKQGL